MEPNQRKAAQLGLWCGVGAYGLWGLVPLYFKAISHVPPVEVLSHRIVWSFLFLALVLSVSRRWGALASGLRSPRSLAILSCSTLLIAVNWLTYIHAVTSDQVLQASLGYFIAPLVNVLLGLFILKERLRASQWVALALASVGVINLTLSAHSLPWIALLLACSFGVYGLLRKTVAVDGLVGLSVETMLLCPIAAVFLAHRATQGGSFGTVSLETDILLGLSGIVTAIPLLLFAMAARRLRLATVGFLQYLAPTFQFLLAVFAFGEPFHLAQLSSFACIWAALALYAFDAVSAYRQLRMPSAVSPLTSNIVPAPVDQALRMAPSAESKLVGCCQSPLGDGEV